MNDIPAFRPVMVEMMYPDTYRKIDKEEDYPCFNETIRSYKWPVIMIGILVMIFFI